MELPLKSVNYISLNNSLSQFIPQVNYQLNYCFTTSSRVILCLTLVLDHEMNIL